MGLDQYAYAALRADQRSDFNRTGEFTDDDFVNKTVPKPINIAYWRKHPNLQGWMERLWWRKTGVPLSEDDQFLQNKYPPGDFNGIELELTWEDLDQLEQDILSNRVSKLDTKGFFFGTPSDSYYRDQDLQFIKDAKAQLFLGLKVFYNSSW